MSFARRIILFLAINFLVVITLSIILNIFNVQPFLTQYGLDLKSLLIFCFIWGMGGALISLSLSRVIAKWALGVKVIDPNTNDPEARELLSVVEALSKKVGLPVMPEVGIYESPEVNAFATGPTKKRSLVAVSRGLLKQMDTEELEGVLAHEIAHIANGDMVTMTLLQGIVNAFVMFLARVLAYVFSGIGRDRKQGSSGSYFGYIMWMYLFEFVFMLLGSILIAWFSRVREYRADKGGAELAGKEKMIHALEALKKWVQKRDPYAEKPAVQALKISTPTKSAWMWIFASHPPLEKRIERLKQLG